jgi:hypothetical protein
LKIQLTGFSLPIIYFILKEIPLLCWAIRLLQLPEDDGDVFFRNNLFLRSDNWPQAEKIEDAAPLFGDANFVNPGGDGITDYIPQNDALVKGKGIAIPAFPGDTVGLRAGLTVQMDILGNPVGNIIDMGAIAALDARDGKIFLFHNKVVLKLFQRLMQVN